MANKQGPENTELIKNEEEAHNQYVLQKNTKTKTGVYIIAAFLTLLVLSVILSAVFFGNPMA